MGCDSNCCTYSFLLDIDLTKQQTTNMGFAKMQASETKLFQQDYKMTGVINLDILLKTMKPKLNFGDFVFCSLKDLTAVNINDILLIFKEDEGITIIVKREIADKSGLDYSFIASWITLTVHSSLGAVGLTAAFSKALSDNGISCNVIAAYYHDHIFVDKKDADKAMEILNKFSA